MFGNSGNDIIYGGKCNDRLGGGNGVDKLFGNFGSDILYGGKGYDLLNGGNGDDKLFGNSGNDILYGGKGNDLLNGGNGNNTLKGGAGDDIFQLNTGVGRDVIKDYQSGEDSIKLLEGVKVSDLTLSNIGGHTTIKYDDDLLAIVQNTMIVDINFI